MDSPLLDLPFELRTLIFSFLASPTARSTISLTCKSLHEEVDSFLYCDIVLHNSHGAKALYRALQAQPRRTWKIKHFTYLYAFGDEGFGETTIEPLPSNDSGKPHTISRSQHSLTPQFRISNIYQLPLLQSLTIRLPNTNDALLTFPDVNIIKRNTASLLAQLLGSRGRHDCSNNCAKLMFREHGIELNIASSCPKLSVLDVDLGYLNSSGDRSDFMDGISAFFVPTARKIKLKRFDACESIQFDVIEPYQTVFLECLEVLVLEDCEVNIKGLEALLKLATKLKCLKLARLESIWEGYVDDGELPNDKARWVDVLRALREASLHDQIETLTLTSRTRHCTIIEKEKPLDLADFETLSNLAIDAHSSVRGLPDSLRRLKIVRPKTFDGACLPLLESRLREVRKCALARETPRRVIFKIPDRSRGYESLRVMADTWASIGFEPKIVISD